MEDYIINIENKLKKKFKLENIEIIDNTYKHKSHKSFVPGKLHLKLVISSIYLSSLSRINAQKLVMKALSEDLRKKIHALEISIKK